MFYGRVSAKVARWRKPVRASWSATWPRTSASRSRAITGVSSWTLGHPRRVAGRCCGWTGDLILAMLASRRCSERVTWTSEYGERIAVVGPNGAGKTTLLRLIAGQLPAAGRYVRVWESTSAWACWHRSRRRSTWSGRCLQTVRRERAMSETEARHFLHFFLFGGDSVFRPVGGCSLGERSRLQLALLVLRAAISCCWTSRSTTWTSRGASISRQRSTPSRDRHHRLPRPRVPAQLRRACGRGARRASAPLPWRLRRLSYLAVEGS